MLQVLHGLLIVFWKMLVIFNGPLKYAKKWKILWIMESNPFKCTLNFPDSNPVKNRKLSVKRIFVQVIKAVLWNENRLLWIYGTVNVLWNFKDFFFIGMKRRLQGCILLMVKRLKIKTFYVYKLEFFLKIMKNLLQ